MHCILPAHAAAGSTSERSPPVLPLPPHFGCAVISTFPHTLLGQLWISTHTAGVPHTQKLETHLVSRPGERQPINVCGKPPMGLGAHTH